MMKSLPGNPGNEGNPNPSPETRFKEGNAGRPAGSKNRATMAANVVEKLHLEAEERPLAFFIRMMRGDPFQFLLRVPPKDRDKPNVVVVKRWYYPTPEDMKWGAAMAAPFLHPKLANIEHTGNVKVKHEEFIDKLIEEEEQGATRH